ncbi:MAG: hypothetical protein R2855_07245 [Thermomicrobiales bacterium]
MFGYSVGYRRLLGAAGVLCLLFALAGTSIEAPGVAAQETAISAEQQLADLYAPVVMIKEQLQECSTNGEQFRPVVVDIIFGTDDVRLMRRGAHGKPDEEIKRGIQASDLFGLDDRHYIDLPFDPRNPGCSYEKWGKKRMAELGITPSIYAFVLTEPGKPGIVVQYWYYWIYNLFNDVHESDWEGVQVYFADATSVQDILEKQPLPTTIGFAQHAGGELGHVGQDKVEMRGTHVVAHPSSGSHADYYAEAVWLGWGEDGSGFGCDHADAPEVEIPVHVVLLPNEVSEATSEFAWLTFAGDWGEVEVPGLFSGPKGPMQHSRWHSPISWLSEIRQNSLAVPVHPTIGPGISQVFCGAAELGSRVVRVFGIDQKLITGLIVAAIVGLLAFTLVAWRYTWEAIRMYVRHGYFFITVGVLAFPIAAMGQRLEAWVQDQSESALLTRLPESTYLRTLWEFVAGAATGTVQEVLLSAVIGPIVTIGAYLIYCAEAGRPAGAWHSDFRIYPRVAASRVLYAVLIELMILSVVLLPLAVYKGVQWFFAPQAVVADDATVRGSLDMSKGRVEGHWIHSAAMVVAVTALIGLPAPLIGTALLMVGGVELPVAQWISAVLFCVLYPIGSIAATLFYLRRSIAPGRVAPYLPDQASAAAPTVPQLASSG